MFVITVQFTVNAANLPEFEEAVVAQADNSLKFEEECHLFDVAVAENNPCVFFLYEIYSNKEAFDAHLETPHFHAFNQLATPWVTNKVVKNWRKL
ncbi:MAG: putative quinol monooxygenase [bacterium]